MRKCRDCNTKIENRFLLCEKCKAIADEKTLTRKREYVKVYRSKRKTQEMPPRKCATDGCDVIVTSKRVYCAECKRQRQLVSMRKYVREKKEYKDPLEYIPQTNLEWLRPFNDHLKANGGEYYQKNTDAPKYVHVPKILRVRI